MKKYLDFSKRLCYNTLAICRIRLAGRGRTIGNRVTGNTVPEFESLILRKQKGHLHGVLFVYFESVDSALLVAMPRIEFVNKANAVVCLQA